MDWPRNEPDFYLEDLSHVFVYSPQPNKAVCRFMGEERIDEYELDSDSEKSYTTPVWLQELSARKNKPGLSIILASRHRKDRNSAHNPTNLEYIPFTRQDFTQITEQLPLHGDTARMINRSDVPFFTDILIGPETLGPETNIYYCCRTSGAWAGDMAVSAVFYPETGFTAAVVFGCSEDIMEEIIGRIDNSEDACAHPMLIMGIIAEIEKERHIKLVQEKLFHLLKRVRTLSKSETVSSTSQISKDNYSIELWIEVSRLRIALNMWKQELLKMQAHVSRLNKDILKPSAAPRARMTLADSTDDETIGDWSPYSEKRSFKDIYAKSQAYDWRLSARQTGHRIKRRLREIQGEYDQKIQECTMVLDGMALSAQLSWSQIGYQDTQANLKIANDTKQDSSQMRSIALLTMVFLPATFISSLFSTTFFNWNANDGEHVISPCIALYFGLIVITTAAVILSWQRYMKHRRGRASHEGNGQGKGHVDDGPWGTV